MKRYRTYLPYLIALLALGARWLPGPRTIDDAFITFRYARHILAGNGFTYNPGAAVLGTTTPLYTLLMAALGALTGGTHAPFPFLALGVNALADAATCLLLIRIGRRLQRPRSGYAAALAWSIAPWSVTFAIGGMETSLYVLLLTLTALAWLEERPALTALSAALALLTRPDALLLLAPLGLDAVGQILRGRLHPDRRAWVGVALSALLLTAWGVFATLRFGSPVPHSVAAKTLAYRLGPTEGLVRLLQHYATPFLLYARLGMWWVGVGLVLYPFLFAIGARRSLAAHPRLWPWMIYPWLYFAAFALANPLIFRWYLTPPLPAYFFGIFLGLEELWDAAPPERESASPTRRLHPGRILRKTGLALGLFLIPFFVPFSTWTLHPDHGLSRPAPDMAWYELELLYRRAAHYLMTQTPPDARPVLAAGDVGVLGFETDWQILDLVGLNSPEATAYYPLPAEMYVINYAVPPDLVLDARPDYLVILEAYGRSGLLQDGRFQKSYRLLEKFDTDIYGSDGMLIFARCAP
ncbi:MAG: hypothetical protein Fur0018_12880 [Anaerolineales bacterium]